MNEEDDDVGHIKSVITLSPKEYDRVLELLENPPKPNEALKKLFRDHGRKPIIWISEEETNKYWQACSEHWEARIEHDGEDSWIWRLSVDDEYLAEGSLYAEVNDESDEGFRKATKLIEIILNQINTWK